nr:retrovirus-related Pol polyprotein from transposon TNT 1-94 [Tanacetum cinerariifolium]
MIPMTASQRKPKNQWTGYERMAANLDQRLKSLIMSVLPDDQMNTVINCLTAKSTWNGLILYHEGPSDVKESRVMDLKLCYNTFKFKECESLTPTFTRYKAFINELVNDDIKLSNLEINTGFINRLPKKWLSFYQSLRNTNNVKDYELASLFGKIKYEENLIYDFQDSPDDEEDTKSSHKYLNDLEEEYQARALLAKSKRFFKKAKYNKVKAKLALLSLSALASKAYMIKNKGLITEAYEWDEEEVSLDDIEMVEVKVLYDHYTGRILLAESQRNTIDPSVVVTDSSTTVYDSADESSVCSTPLPPLKKLNDDEPISGPKTIKSILRSKSTFKTEALKGVIINEPSSAPAKGNKCSSALKVHSAPAGKLKSVKIKDDHPLAIVMKELNNLKLQVNKNQSSYSRSNQSQQYPLCGLCGSYDHDINGHNGIISLEREINPRNPQHALRRCEVCGSSTHTTTVYYDIEWFKRGEALQVKKAEFDKKRGTIFNSNKEVVMIAPRVRDVYVLDITSSAQESCFFAKASKNLNWLWHKRLVHLNFKTINKLEKQNLVIGLSSLVYSKDKPCSSCEKEKHHRAIYIHNQKDHLGKFDKRADDGYLLGYSLVSKAFRVFNTRRQQTEKTYHITFDESPYTIKFSKPLVDNINIAEIERYPPNEYLHPYEPSQSNEQIIENLQNTKDIQISEHLSSPSVEDTSIQNTIPIPTPSLPISSMVTPAPQDRWSQDKYIELVNIIGNPRAKCSQEPWPYNLVLL